jgi:hypothetical protein
MEEGKIELDASYVTADTNFNVIDKGNICGPCIKGRHNECKRTMCSCDNMTHPR